MMRVVTMACLLPLLLSACDDSDVSAAGLGGPGPVAPPATVPGGVAPAQPAPAAPEDLAATYPGGMYLTYSPLSDLQVVLRRGGDSPPLIALAGVSPLRQFLEASLTAHINVSVAVLYLDFQRREAGFARADSLTGRLEQIWRGDAVLDVGRVCHQFLVAGQAFTRQLARVDSGDWGLPRCVEFAETADQDPWLPPRRLGEAVDSLRARMEREPAEVERLRTVDPAVFHKLQGIRERYDLNIRDIRTTEGQLQEVERTQLIPGRPRPGVDGGLRLEPRIEVPPDVGERLRNEMLQGYRKVLRGNGR